MYTTKTLFALLLVLFTFSCNQEDPMSVNDNATDASPAYTPNQSMLVDGPLSAEQLDAITLPEEKIQVADKDFRILKSKNAISLQKRFVRSWYIPVGWYGWAFVGDEIHGRSWLYFPLNAMSQNTTVTMDWESTGFLEGGAEFSPHGTQFNVPVTVWLSYKDADLGGIDEQDLKIWYYNEEDGAWELIGDTVDTQNKMVGGVLHHFSRYAIGYGE